MLAISATDGWREAHSGAHIGLLEMAGLENQHASPDLEAQKGAIEARLRARYQDFTRRDFLALPVMGAYERYYRRFNKTYHVLLQLESIVLKGKNLPQVSPAVDANFMAEVETLVLTAGHDVAQLRGAITIDASIEGDRMTLMNGNSKVIRAGDMIMRDAAGISCSILYGQDNRSPISPQTRGALYVAYAPAGVPETAVAEQLERIVEYLRMFSSPVTVEQLVILSA